MSGFPLTVKLTDEQINSTGIPDADRFFSNGYPVIVAQSYSNVSLYSDCIVYRVVGCDTGEWEDYINVDFSKTMGNHIRSGVYGVTLLEAIYPEYTYEAFKAGMSLSQLRYFESILKDSDKELRASLVDQLSSSCPEEEDGEEGGDLPDSKDHLAPLKRNINILFAITGILAGCVVGGYL